MGTNLKIDNAASWLVFGVLLLCIFHIWGWFPLFWVVLGHMALQLIGGGTWKREMLELQVYCRDNKVENPFEKDKSKLETAKFL